MDISVVGAGRVGTALAVLLQRAGHRIVAVAGRDSTGPRAEKYLPGVPLLPVPEASAPAEVVLLGVPDSMIEPIATDLQLRADAAVVHLSGALGLEALRRPEAKGHTVVALHPLQTFPTVMAGVQWVPGSSAAITARTEEGFALGERLAVDVGARPFRIPDDVRPLYHAGAVLASGAVVALL